MSFGKYSRTSNPLLDLAGALPETRIELAIDAGAHTGGFTSELISLHPHAVVHCVEPVVSNFIRLKETFCSSGTVHCHQLALSSHEGKGRMLLSDTSSRHRLVSPDQSGARTEEVQVATIERFCSDQSIRAVGILKIDCEGAEIEILKGAEPFLRNGAIDIIMTEAGTNPENRWHVPMESIKAYLEQFGYRLFGFYDQVGEFPSLEPHLRRADLIFVSGSVIMKNKGKVRL